MKFEYRPDIDIPTVEREEFQDFEENLELDGFVLDLDSDGDFLGLEIIDASQKTSLSRKELEKINKAEVEFERSEEYIRVEVVLEINDSTNVISSRYPATALA